MNSQPLKIEIGLRTWLTAVLVVAACALVAVLWPIVLVVLVALMLAAMLSPPIAYLERKRFRRVWAITLVVGLLVVSLGLLSAFVFPRLAVQGADLFARLPAAQEKLADELVHNRFTRPLGRSLRAFKLADLVSQANDSLLALSLRVVEAFTYGGSALFLSLYLILDRDRMRGALYAVTPRNYHLRLSRILLGLETIVGGYLRGQVITSVLMGLFTAAVLLLFDVPHVLLLSGIAAVADVLPYVGGFLACGPAVVVALGRGGTPVALGVLTALVAYQEFESRVIVPKVYGDQLRLPASVVILALLVGAKLLGVLGALLALPIASGLLMIIAELRLKLPGDAADHSAVERIDRAAEQTFEVRSAGASPEAAAVIATEIAEISLKAEAALQATEELEAEPEGELLDASARAKL